VGVSNFFIKMSIFYFSNFPMIFVGYPPYIIGKKMKNNKVYVNFYALTFGAGSFQKVLPLKHPRSVIFGTP